MIDLTSISCDIRVIELEFIILAFELAQRLKFMNIAWFLAIALTLLCSIGIESPANASQSDKKHKHYKDETEWWKASFDRSMTAPDSEDPDRLSSIVLGGKMLMEERQQNLNASSFRLVYGTPGHFKLIRDDKRTKEVNKSIASSLEAVFGRNRPQFIAPGGAKNQSRTMIVKGRRGYTFAFLRDAPQLIEKKSKGFRYKEQELIDALALSIDALDLESTIHWSRSKVFIFNIWERLNYKAL